MYLRLLVCLSGMCWGFCYCKWDQEKGLKWFLVYVEVSLECFAIREYIFIESMSWYEASKFLLRVEAGVAGLLLGVIL